LFLLCWTCVHYSYSDNISDSDYQKHSDRNILHLTESEILHRSDNSPVINPKKYSSRFPSSLQEPTSLVPVVPHACINSTKLHGGHLTIICVKSPTVDEFVSGSIIRTGTWEGHIINLVIRAMDNYKEAVLLDLGSNLGIYSLAVAAMGRKAVAVDAVAQNLAYVRHSLQLAGRVDMVRLLDRPVSDKKEVLYPVTDNAANQGGTRLVTRDKLGKNVKPSGPPVETATLMELLTFVNSSTVIVKMDVEGMECKVLQPEVFQTSVGVFLPYIVMEWMHVRVNLDNNCPDLEGLVSLLTRSGYTPWDPVSKRKAQLTGDKTVWPGYDDLLWQHQFAAPLL